MHCLTITCDLCDDVRVSLSWNPCYTQCWSTYRAPDSYTQTEGKGYKNRQHVNWKVKKKNPGCSSECISLVVLIREWRKNPFLLFLTAKSCWCRKSAAWASPVSKSTDIHTGSEEGASQLPGWIWIWICYIPGLSNIHQQKMGHSHESPVLQLPFAQGREGRGIILGLHNKQNTPHREWSPGLLLNTVQLHTSLKKRYSTTWQ